MNGASNRTMRRVTLADDSITHHLDISWPAGWSDERAVKEIRRAIQGVKTVTLGPISEKFPDIELMDDGAALSLAHLLYGP